MTQKSRFNLVYAPQVKQHVRIISRKYHSLIRSTIEAQLQFEPDVETKNRKPLKRSLIFEADWEIRFGPNNQFRVFYEVDYEHSEIHILAIGVKRGNRLFIGREEFEL